MQVVSAMPQESLQGRGRSPQIAATLWRDGASNDGIDRDAAAWYAVWTRSHCEQLVRDQLVAKRFEVFLPTTATWARRSSTRRQVNVPLFPGYLFVHLEIDRASHVEILKARGVVRVLGDGCDRLAPVPDEQIDSLQRVLSSDLPVLPHPHLSAGDRVRITGGPLEGLSGIFLRGRPAKGLLVLSVNLLQRSIAIEVDCTLVASA